MSLIGIGVAMVVLGVWVAGTDGAFAGRHAGLSARTRRVVAAAIALAVFAAIGGDVLVAERNDLVPRLDRRTRVEMREAREYPAVRTAARAVSRATGEGLAIIVGIAAIALARRGRRQEALVVVASTLASWPASGILKAAFGIPRPRADGVLTTITRAGFPSGHTFVATVAVGLIAWALVRRADPWARAGVYVVAAVAAVLTGLSRLILDAHWLSDVIGGLAIGTAWINVSLLIADRGRRDGATRSTGAAG